MAVLKKQQYEKFAQELAKGISAVDAYVAAGYDRDNGNASKLARKPLIKARIEELKAKGAERAEISIEKVLRELALIGFANMDDYMRVGDDGDPFLDFSKLTREQAAAIVEVTVEDFKEGRGEAARDVRRVKMKLADKKGALVDIGRHLGMFKDRTVLENPDGSAVTPAAPIYIFQLPDNGRG